MMSRLAAYIGDVLPALSKHFVEEGAEFLGGSPVATVSQGVLSIVQLLEQAVVNAFVVDLAFGVEAGHTVDQALQGGRHVEGDRYGAFVAGLSTATR